ALWATARSPRAKIVAGRASSRPPPEKLEFQRTAKPAIRSRDEFEDLLIDIVRKKAKDAGRRATAAKRDARKQVDLSDTSAPYESGRLAHELVMAEELAQEIEEIVAEEADDEKLAIARLGIISHLTPSEILKVLAASHGRVPALRTVQKIVQEGKNRLAD